MANIIEAPEILQLTTNWSDIQYTNLHYYHPIKSDEVNKLLKAFGRGSFFVVRGFKIAIFKDIVDGVEACIARLTPGILVHDFTIIDYIQRLKEEKKFIYVKLFDETDDPSPGKIFKLGSRYYHGTLGDGIRSAATYDVLESINIHERYQYNFRTLYRITLGKNYGSNGSIIDLDNIIIDDLRFPPTNVEVSDEVDPYLPNAEDVIKMNPDDNSVQPTDPISDTTDEVSDSKTVESGAITDVDYIDLLSRSNSLMWSIVFN